VPLSTQSWIPSSGADIAFSEEALNLKHPRDIVIVSGLMIIFGSAEVTTAITHNFFGVTTSEGTASAYVGVVIGLLYIAAGVLILPMKRQTSALAIAFLLADVIGRVAMIVTGLYRLESVKQTVAIILGTLIVVVFAVYIRLRWDSFR
jgi:hypothetical protein